MNGMAVSLELHNPGDSSMGAEIQALVEHRLVSVGISFSLECWLERATF
jgi:hypothetical protein